MSHIEPRDGRKEARLLGHGKDRFATNQQVSLRFYTQSDNGHTSSFSWAAERAFNQVVFLFFCTHTFHLNHSSINERQKIQITTISKPIFSFLCVPRETGIIKMLHIPKKTKNVPSSDEEHKQGQLWGSNNRYHQHLEAPPQISKSFSRRNHTSFFGIFRFLSFFFVLFSFLNFFFFLFFCPLCYTRIEIHVNHDYTFKQLQLSSFKATARPG